MGSGAPIRLLHDRVLVDTEGEPGERRSASGIVIPATAQMGKRLAWATVVAVGANVRTVEVALVDGVDEGDTLLVHADVALVRVPVPAAGGGWA